MGPCPEAREACASMIPFGGRYRLRSGQGEEHPGRAGRFAEGSRADFPRISAPLHQAVLAFTSPAKPFVAGDPGYEAGGRAAGISMRRWFWSLLR